MIEKCTAELAWPLVPLVGTADFRLVVVNEFVSIAVAMFAARPVKF